MNKKKLLLKSILFVFLISIISLLIHSCEGEKAEIEKSVLWKKETGHYNGYRIPSLIVTKHGTLLAFCEGRERGDTGDIDLLLKRSENNGKTWSEEQIVWDDAKNTCGNPCPVVDEETGRILLFMTWNDGESNEGQIIRKESPEPRYPYMCYSDDDGLTWSVPENMAESCRDTSWGWYATGPGFGIQIKNGKYKGRLVIPANHSYDDPKGNLKGGKYEFGAHVLFSDDHGKTWEIGEYIKPGCNESQVTELSDGTLVMNMRSYNDKNSRAISKSDDGGVTWSGIEHDYQLVESLCQASILNFGLINDKNAHLFLNPGVPFSRTNLTLKSSFDDCNSWSNSKLIYEGPAAYSCLTKLPNGNIGMFFEAGLERPYENLVYVSFDPDELFTAGNVLNTNDFKSTHK